MQETRYQTVVGLFLYPLVNVDLTKHISSDCLPSKIGGIIVLLSGVYFNLAVKTAYLLDSRSVCRYNRVCKRRLAWIFKSCSISVKLVNISCLK